jgi:hypothetical protein
MVEIRSGSHCRNYLTSASNAVWESPPAVTFPVTINIWVLRRSPVVGLRPDNPQTTIRLPAQARNLSFSSKLLEGHPAKALCGSGVKLTTHLYPVQSLRWVELYIPHSPIGIPGAHRDNLSPLYVWVRTTYPSMAAKYSNFSGVNRSVDSALLIRRLVCFGIIYDLQQGSWREP